MNALVLYHSEFGNTERIAHSIAAALAGSGAVETRSIAELTAIPAGVDLLVVGGPTQGHGVDADLARFLDRLPGTALDGVAVAAFDTRLTWPRFLSGAAAPGIAKRLEAKGARLVAPPESFLVTGKEGPLVEGEAERAGAWGRELTGVPVT